MSQQLLFKEVGYTVSALLDQIEMGTIGLPDLQRPFVWKNAKVRDLLDSMYRGYPVGYLLFWQNPSGSDVRAIGTGDKQREADLLIVDGQQRLTSLFAVIKGKAVVREDFSESAIEIAFHPPTGEFKVADNAIRRSHQWISNVSRVWAADTNLFAMVGDYLTALREVQDVDAQDERRIQNNIQKLHNLANYPFQTLELLSSVDIEEVSDIFQRINSKGETLNQADFILTLMSVYWKEGREALEDFSRDSKQPGNGKTPWNHFIQPSPDQMLRVEIGYGFKRGRLEYAYQLLRGKNLATKHVSDTYREEQFARLKKSQADTLNLQHWKDYLKCLVQAGFRSGSLVTSRTALLYCYVFYLLGKLEYGVGEATLRRTIARWFFASHLTRRYTSSPESALEQDLLQLRDVHDADAFTALLDQNIAANLTNDYWQYTLPEQLDTSTGRSPALSGYFAALCLLDATVLFSKLKISSLLDPTTDAARNALERHHLFPKQWLIENGYPDIYQTNQIANYAMIEWPDNMEILDSAPSEYWPTFTDRYTEKEWEQMHYWHALPEGWEQMHYMDFIRQRRILIAQVTRDGFRQI